MRTIRLKKMRAFRLNKMRTVRLVLLIQFLALPLVAVPIPRGHLNLEPINHLAVQERGRIKPFEVFATESLLFVTGKRQWKGMSSSECILGWLMVFEKEWENEPFIRLDYTPVIQALGLPSTSHFFTLKEIQNNEQLPKLLGSIGQKEENKERLTSFERKVLQLANQRAVVEAIISGSSLTILPNPNGHENWFSLFDLGQNPGMLSYSDTHLSQLRELLKKIIADFSEGQQQKWAQTATTFAGFIKRDLAHGAYPAEKTLSREIHYNRLRPFRYSWMLYGLACLLLLIHNIAGASLPKNIGVISLLAGFLLHTYGFALRMMVSGRPPVTNMYESVVWVSWGAILFALIIWAFYRSIVIPNAATVFSVVALVLADNLPTVLDAGIHPLEPVLRSNFWLTLHVLTITLGYAAFALSLCLGNVTLGIYLFRPHHTLLIQQYSLYMYRAVQIGVVLLAAGTILGGVWADYSWGRFWGWDPKEVWALIALLLYIAVLHGRFAGWLKGFGFVTCSVISFVGVLMAWYGVNFVLGVGLHSYGFGTGGIQWMLAYVVLQLLFITVAYVRWIRK